MKELSEKYTNNAPVAQKLWRYKRNFNKVFNCHEYGEHDNTSDQTANHLRVSPRKGITTPAYTEQEACCPPNDCESTEVVKSFQSFHELEFKGFET